MERTRIYKKWMMSDLSFIRRHLPYTSRKTIASALGVSVGALDWAVRTHELKKDAEDPLVAGIKEHITNIRAELKKIENGAPSIKP